MSERCEICHTELERCATCQGAGWTFENLPCRDCQGRGMVAALRAERDEAEEKLERVSADHEQLAEMYRELEAERDEARAEAGRLAGADKRVAELYADGLDQEERVHALTAQRDELAAALEPFAEMWEHLREHAHAPLNWRTVPVQGHGVEPKAIEAKHLIAATELLARLRGEGEG